MNINFEKDGEDTLKINIEGRGIVEPFLKTLDILLISVHGKKKEFKLRKISRS